VRPQRSLRSHLAAAATGRAVECSAKREPEALEKGIVDECAAFLLQVSEMVRSNKIVGYSIERARETPAMQRSAVPE
jgi:hypothetical protein